MLKFHDFSKITDRDGFNFTLQELPIFVCTLILYVFEVHNGFNFPGNDLL